MAVLMTSVLGSAAPVNQAHRRASSATPARAGRVFEARRHTRLIAAADSDTSLTGEWPVNWSLASYEDVGEFFQNQLFKESTEPGSTLQEVMSTNLQTATPNLTRSELEELFKEVSGLPVVKSATDKTLIGVVSKKDLQKPGTTVKDFMSAPPVAARPTNKVADAACLMLKHKVHRIPVVDSSAKIVGIVTRTDIFNALSNSV